MSIVAAEIKAKYPILESETTDRIQLFINDALGQVSPDYYGDDWPRAIELWVLCRMVNLTPSLRSEGAVSDETLMGQQRTRKVKYGSGALRMLTGMGSAMKETNPYCQELAELTGDRYYGGCVY